jgi:hypothetical protein
MATRLPDHDPRGLWDDETAIATFALDGPPEGAAALARHPSLKSRGATCGSGAVLSSFRERLGVRLPGRSPALVAPALYLLGRRFLSAAPLLVAALWAVAFWPLNIGRWGHVNSFTPLFFCLAMGWVWDGLSTGRRKPWILAGALFGISLYVYSANRALAFLVLAFVAYWALIYDRSSRRRAAAGLFLFPSARSSFRGADCRRLPLNPAMYLSGHDRSASSTGATRPIRGGS